MDFQLKGQPNKKQELFFKAQGRHIAYGGARGGGKSWGARRKLLMLGFNYPNLKMILFRRSFPELHANHILPLMEELAPLLNNGTMRYVDKDHIFYFPNGSILRLAFAEREKDVFKYQGHEYDVVFLEEATHFTESQKDFLTTINRTTRTDFKPRIYYTANPGGVGHGWFKRLFIDRRYRRKEKAEDYVFIPAKVYDNTVLMESDPGYVETLENLPELMRRAHLEGDWTIFSGQFFTEFRDDPENYASKQNTHVIRGFPIPETWKRYRSFDWGYSRPFSVGWWAIDHDGVAYRYRELYGCTGDPDVGVRWTPDQVAKKIAEIERELEPEDVYITGIADPAIWDVQTGESIAEVMAKHGIFFEKADNKRLNGWQQMRTRMMFDDDGYAMLYVFDNCKEFIRTLPLLVHDDHQVEDLDTKQEDHIADETRYFCMARPVKPRIIHRQKQIEYDPLDRHLDNRVASGYGFIRRI